MEGSGVIDKKTLTSLALWISVAAFSILKLTGCNMNHPIIKEMEAALATSSANTHEERDEAASRVVRRYFPPGMKSEEAFKLLRQLREQGFDISENRRESARDWPDGELKPYRDGFIQRHYPKGVSVYVAEKQYGVVIRYLATKHVFISFSVIDGSGVISEVRGTLVADGI
jgi:hypothetical protein